VERRVERGTGRRVDEVRAGLTGARLGKFENGAQVAFIVLGTAEGSKELE
jgi:hypothetical protein